MRTERIHPPGEAPGECFYEMDRAVERQRTAFQVRRIANELRAQPHPGPFEAEWLDKAAEFLEGADV
jgi:hypothetical protein